MFISPQFKDYLSSSPDNLITSIYEVIYHGSNRLIKTNIHKNYQCKCMQLMPMRINLNSIQKRLKTTKPFFMFNCKWIYAKPSPLGRYHHQRRLSFNYSFVELEIFDWAYQLHSSIFFSFHLSTVLWFVALHIWEKNASKNLLPCFVLELNFSFDFSYTFASRNWFCRFRFTNRENISWIIWVTQFRSQG